MLPSQQQQHQKQKTKKQKQKKKNKKIMVDLTRRETRVKIIRTKYPLTKPKN